MNKYIPKYDKKTQTVTFKLLPTDLQSGDVIFMSPSSEMRGQKDLKWYQRFWNAVDKRVRKWIDE